MSKISGEIGKIREFKQGFIIKIGERGDRSFLVLCFSSYNTFKLTRDEIAWLQTLAFYTNVSLENVMKIEELMVHLEDLKQQESNPVWLKNSCTPSKKNNALISPAISTTRFYRI